MVGVILNLAFPEGSDVWGDLNCRSLGTKRFTISLKYFSKPMYKRFLGVKWFFQNDFWMIHV